MKIFLVSFNFAPYQSIGSLRISKLARYLCDQGHEVRVLAAKDIPERALLAVEVDPASVAHTPWLNANFLPELVFGGRKQVRSKGYSTQSSSVKSLGFLYQTLFNLPDERVGWYPYAVSAGKKLLRGWKPDLIYASMPPATSLLVAARLSRISGVPWVAELRDLWVDNANYIYPGWRRSLESWLERSTLRGASGLVTVSQPWADLLQRKFGLPTAVAMNGYAPEDMPGPDEALNPAFEPGLLRIVYTGTVYPHSQDPAPLFAALALLGEDARRVRTVFYSRYVDAVQDAAVRAGVEGCVEHHPLVPYRESLRIQQSADLLLYLVPNQQGFVPAKLFEYLAARRPVLAVGAKDSVPGALIQERSAGLVSNDPVEIAAWLRAQLDAKARTGPLPALPASAAAGLSRGEQFAALERFLLDLPLKRAR